MNNNKNELKINSFKNLTKNAVSFSTRTIGDAKEFTKDKALPKLRESVINTKESVSDMANKITNKVKTSINEEQMLEVLNSLYIKSINGIPKVSLPIDDLVNDYVDKNKDVELAAKSLINNSIVKCGTSGFVTGLGGFTTIIATLPANITSVMYIQLRMCCAIAKMAGYDIKSDQVQTLIFACLTGSAVSDVLKQTGIKFGNKLGVSLVNKIPGKTLQIINQKVGFRFITKFGEKGIINLGKVVPVLGGVIGGGVDVASTRIIGNNAYKIFIKGELPTNKDVGKEIVMEAEFAEIDDIDCKTLENAIEKGVNAEDIIS
ncbi:MAG: EcsC family protein [Bacilli bacterium]|nr:EcsC family protein [Bacilli bacterium]